MNELNKLFENNQKWSEKMKSQDATFFENLVIKIQFPPNFDAFNLMQTDLEFF